MALYRPGFCRFTRVAVFLLGYTGAIWAQSGFEAQIRGTVTDPASALVAGATIRLTDQATGIETHSVSNGHGL